MKVKGFTACVRLLTPLAPAYWAEDHAVLMNCIGHWLPQNKISCFSDSTLYDAWMKISGNHLEPDENLAIKVPILLGGEFKPDNFQIRNIFDYYKSTAAIYAPLFQKK